MNRSNPGASPQRSVLGASLAITGKPTREMPRPARVTSIAQQMQSRSPLFSYFTGKPDGPPLKPPQLPFTSTRWGRQPVARFPPPHPPGASQPPPDSTSRSALFGKRSPALQSPRLSPRPRSSHASLNNTASSLRVAAIQRSSYLWSQPAVFPPVYTHPETVATPCQPPAGQSTAAATEKCSHHM